MNSVYNRIVRKAARARQEQSLVRSGRALALLIILFGGIDLISTNAALGAGQVEGNPIVRFWMAQAGQWWSVPKMAVHYALACLVLWLPSRRMIKLGRIVVIGYVGIALNNLYLAGALSGS